jgi:hypothetical protein
MITAGEIKPGRTDDADKVVEIVGEYDNSEIGEISSHRLTVSLKGTDPGPYLLPLPKYIEYKNFAYVYKQG